MSESVCVRYHGWSTVSIETPAGAMHFDPFFRKYCGAEWFSVEDFLDAKYIAVTHGHEEHFLDVPVIARRTGAQVIGPKSIMQFLRLRNRIPRDRLIPLDASQRVALTGFAVEAFAWRHRDINLYKALGKAVFHGNTIQLSWAWHSATQAPFYAPYTGYRVKLPDGTTVINYNEGFNTKMTDAEIGALAAEGPTDVLLGGMQLNFVADVARGVAALKPKLVLLYPPHEKFHEMMGMTSRPWSEFVAAAERAAPQARVVPLAPGTRVSLADGSVSRFEPRRRVSSVQ